MTFLCTTDRLYCVEYKKREPLVRSMYEHRSFHSIHTLFFFSRFTFTKYRNTVLLLLVCACAISISIAQAGEKKKKQMVIPVDLKFRTVCRCDKNWRHSSHSRRSEQWQLFIYSWIRFHHSNSKDQFSCCFFSCST